MLTTKDVKAEFKVNREINIALFRHHIKADYRYYYFSDSDRGKQHEPYMAHIDFGSKPGVISVTGYPSYFFAPATALTLPNLDSLEQYVIDVALELIKEQRQCLYKELNQLVLF